MTTKRTKFGKVLLALGAAIGLSACASAPVTRDLPPGAALDAVPASVSLNALGPVDVVAINVSVPETLLVSEKNSYYPGGDIVWHGDPVGNRRDQVKAIFEAAMANGTSDMTGDRKVMLDIVVTRFHSLTPKARYTVGGVHAIQFHLQVRDAETLEVLVPSHFIKADFKGYGGAAALEAEAMGETQKVRITNQLARVIRQELAQPGSFVHENTGVIGALNQL